MAHSAQRTALGAQRSAPTRLGSERGVRSSEFNQVVTARISRPEGLTVAPETIAYQSGQAEGTITLKATEDAPVGQLESVEVLFEPETGQSVVNQLEVTVVAQQS